MKKILENFWMSTLMAATMCCLITTTTSAQETSQRQKASPTGGVINPAPLWHNRPKPNPALAEAGNQANKACTRGEAFLKSGDADAALSSFNEALTYEPEYSQAYLGLAATYEVKGQFNKAITVYRSLFYDWSGKGWGSSDETKTTNLMKFALLLLKTGQREEALKVYRQGFHFLPTDRGPMPPLFTTLDFATNDFRAAAYTAMGIYEISWADSDAGEADFYQAIATQPSLSTPYFYRGLKLKGKPGRAADAVADFARAEQLGGSSVKPFVDKELREGPSEFLNAVKKVQADPTL